MNQALNWIRANPVLIAAGAVILVALLFVGWVYSASATLRTEIADSQKSVRELERFLDQSVQLPPETLGDEPMRVEGVTFNRPAIQRLQNIFTHLNGEAEALRDQAEQINRDGHTVLLDGVFPSVTSGGAARFDFQNRYRFAMDSLLGSRAAAEELGRLLGKDRPTPYLESGLPPSAEELEALIEQAVRDGQRAMGVGLSDQQRTQIRDEARGLMLQRVLSRAREIDIYADPRLELDPTTFNPGFPLTVASWAFDGTPPLLWQMWEGQMLYWIQSDIIKALAQANGVDSSAPEAAANVLEAPVKRLLSLEVLPGSVGLHNGGGVGTAAGGREANAANSLTVLSLPNAPPATLTQGSPDVAIAANYHFSPTGRRSTPLIDVRHVRLKLHADYHRLPQLINAISGTNLMSVVDLSLRGLDEADFATLDGPYFYGEGEIVEVDLLIESVWLKSWLSAIMPPDVRQAYGVPPPGA